MVPIRGQKAADATKASTQLEEVDGIRATQSPEVPLKSPRGLISGGWSDQDQHNSHLV